QSSAGQEWQRERDDLTVSVEQTQRTLQTALVELLESVEERPRLRGRTFLWGLWFSDATQREPLRLLDAREESTFPLDVRWLNSDQDRDATWVQKSADKALENRVLWVVRAP